MIETHTTFVVKEKPHERGPKLKILVADDEKIVRSTLQRQLEDNHHILVASSLKEAIQTLEREVVDLAFIDLHLDESDELTGTTLIQHIHKSSPSTILIAMTGLEDPDLIAKCYSLGASDYIFKPILSKTVQLILQRAKTIHRLIRQNRSLKTQAGDQLVKKLSLTTKSPAFQKVIDRALKLKGTKESILIRGESGVGKELMAQFLWSLEDDDSRPFVPVNCGAITSTLAESELFGHKKGAFSGATENRIGKFEEADDGDIFLDEIATLPQDIQNKLLRTLNNGEITPLGQNLPKKVNCRVIAATNESLEEMVKSKMFREDILFRLKKFTITVPPLRERKEDIPDLVQQFLAAKGFESKSLTKEAIKFCVNYQWPGNVRELQSTIHAAALFSGENEIRSTDIESQLESGTSPEAPPLQNALPSPLNLDEDMIHGNFNRLAREFEQRLVKYALTKSESDAGAAKLLGLPRSTLRSKVKQWGWE